MLPGSRPVPTHRGGQPPHVSHRHNAALLARAALAAAGKQGAAPRLQVSHRVLPPSNQRCPPRGACFGKGQEQRLVCTATEVGLVRSLGRHWLLEVPPRPTPASLRPIHPAPLLLLLLAPGSAGCMLLLMLSSTSTRLWVSLRRCRSPPVLPPPLLPPPPLLLGAPLLLVLRGLGSAENASKAGPLSPGISAGGSSGRACEASGLVNTFSAAAARSAAAVSAGAGGAAVAMAGPARPASLSHPIAAGLLHAPCRQEGGGGVKGRCGGGSKERRLTGTAPPARGNTPMPCCSPHGCHAPHRRQAASQQPNGRGGGQRPCKRGRVQGRPASTCGSPGRAPSRMW